jgi:hypothetical protein
MAETAEQPLTNGGSTEVTRFNALRHGVLSRYTVLPWECVEDYETLLGALAAEHGPQGPTEEHLVEEIAGILWRKGRLRQAEAAAFRQGLQGTLSRHDDAAIAALVHLHATGDHEQLGYAIPLFL